MKAFPGRQPSVAPSKAIVSNESVSPASDDAITNVHDSGEPAASKSTACEPVPELKYVSPEQITSTGHESTAPDLWAAGVVLYIMLCGFPPWTATDTAALFDQIQHARFSFPSPWWDTVSAPAKDLLRGLMTADPALRLTAAQAAKHPWIETCGGALAEDEAGL